MTTVQTQLSSCHAVNQLQPGPGSIRQSPHCTSFPLFLSLPLAAAATPVGQNLARIAITFIDISAAARSHRATEACLSISSNELRCVHVRYPNAAAIF